MKYTFPAYITVEAATEALAKEAIEQALRYHASYLRGPKTDQDRKGQQAMNLSWTIGPPSTVEK